MSPQILFALLIAAFLATSLPPAASAQATWTPLHEKTHRAKGELVLQAQDLSRRELARMQQPAIVDAAELRDQLCAAEEDLTALVNQLGDQGHGHHRRGPRRDIRKDLLHLQTQLAQLQRDLGNANAVTSYRVEGTLPTPPRITPDRRGKLQDPRQSGPKNHLKPLTEPEFTTLQKALQDNDNKARPALLTNTLGERSLTTAQASALVSLFYRNDRLGALIALYESVSDPALFHQTYALLYRDQRSALATRINAIEDELATRHNVHPAQANFQAVADTLRSVYRDQRLIILQSILHHNTFTSAQTRELTQEFFYRDQHVQALSMLYPRVIDPENFHTVYDILYSEDRTRLIRWIDEQRG